MMSLLLLVGCEHLKKIEVKGEVTGNRYSNSQFTKGKHLITAFYPINENVRVRGRVSQTYVTDHKMDNDKPDYGEVGLEFIF